jgi:ferredoxin-NADP reductase
MMNPADREILSATLLENRLLCSASQTHHLKFRADAGFAFHPGQFISVLAERLHAPTGQMRLDTRAYSLASAPAGQHFALCVNRVGYFSNLLCDLAPDAAIRFHGPHGHFTLGESTAPLLLLAEETGIAPLRSLLHAAPGTAAHLLHASLASDPALYASEFTALPALRYTPLRDDSAHTASLQAVQRLLAGDSRPREARIVGLSSFVNAHRAQLKALGWDRKQIIFERYD